MDVEEDYIGGVGNHPVELDYIGGIGSHLVE